MIYMSLNIQSLSYKKSVLHFGEQSLEGYCQNYSGPTYIYNLDLLKQRFALMQKALGKVKLHYAMKANSNVEVLRTLRRLGAGVDVVSVGEVQRALLAGFLPEDIIYSGVGKTRREIEESIRIGIHQLNVESIPELLRIGEISKTFNRRVSVALRLNPDVNIQTHPYIATGLRDNKFGIELGALPEVKVILQKQPHLRLVGVSLHIGSQMHEFDAFQEALQKLRPVYRQIKKDFPTVHSFDFGGGLGIYYEKFDWNPEIEGLHRYADVVEAELRNWDCERQAEPGRWLVARAGVLLCQVQYVKKTSHKTFLILDSGMNHLIRPALYDSYHRIWSVQEIQEKETYDVVGPICESGDFFAKDRNMSKVQEGDFLVIADTGAYGYSMTNQYNLQALPREICIPAIF